MPRLKLTKTMVENAVAAGLPDGKAHMMLWDGARTGLGLKLRSTGAASWVYTYRPRGAGRGVASRTVTLGRWPDIGVDKARAAAEVHIGKIALGSDPAVEMRTERRRERAGLRLALDDYEADLRRRRIVNVKTIMSTLRRGLSGLLAREMAAISRADVMSRVEAIEAAGKPGAAHDLRVHTRSLLEWSVNRGLRDANPLAGLRRPRASRAERIEELETGKALDDVEIRAVWNAAGDRGAFGGLVRLGLLTGLRRSELAGLKRADVSDDRITIGRERAKTGAQHHVPLTTAMRAVLSAQPQTTSDLIFPSPRRKAGTAQLSGWTQLVAGLVKASNVHFTMHDLRRTVRTVMSHEGISEADAELAIGHVRTGLIGIYNRDTAWAARTRAFEAVSNHVSRVITGTPDSSGEANAAQVLTMAPAKKQARRA